MLRNSGGPSLLRGRLGVQVVADDHTIDDSLAAHEWDATKREQHGQGPISVQRCVGHTRRRLGTDSRHLQTLEKPFQCRKEKVEKYIMDKGHSCLRGACRGARGAYSGCFFGNHSGRSE